MQNKKLLERIKSLEEFLGVKYVPRDDEFGYSEHISTDYSVTTRLRKLEDKKK